MKRTTLGFACLGVLVAASCLLGCGRQESTNGEQPSREESTATSDFADWSAHSKEIPAPATKTRDYFLPEGCEISDYTSRLAVYDQWTGKEYPATVLGILDLETGEHQVVLDTPVRGDKMCVAFTPRTNGEWIVWEEVTQNEMEDPAHADWYLFAARIDDDLKGIGAPVLVDNWSMAMCARPFYGFHDDELVWTRNRVTLTVQEMSRWGGELYATKLPPTKEERLIYSSKSNWSAVRIAGETAVMAEAVHNGPDTELVVVDLESGEESHRRRVPERWQVSDFVEESNGWFLWTAGQSFRGWPSLYATDEAGRLFRIEIGSMDPLRVGDYVIFEQMEHRKAPRTRGGNQLTGIDLSAGTRFFLDSPVTVGKFQLPSSAGSREDLLLAYFDNGAYEDGENVRTLVRAYKFTEGGGR